MWTHLYSKMLGFEKFDNFFIYKNGCSIIFNKILEVKNFFLDTTLVYVRILKVTLFFVLEII